MKHSPRRRKLWNPFDLTVATKDIEHSLALSRYGKLEQTDRDPAATVHKEPFEKSEESITIDDAMWWTNKRLYLRHESWSIASHQICLQRRAPNNRILNLELSTQASPPTQAE
jgi:hypothetical protein